MTATISGSVGQGGVNKPADVTIVQKLLNLAIGDLALPQLVVNGTADAASIAAINEFQRRVVKLPTPDGCIDPTGKTLKALNAAADAATAASIVTYGANVEAADRLVSPYAIRVIEKAVRAAGFAGAVMTSTIRRPIKQATIMYGEAMKDLAAQYALYGDAGDKVLDVFKANKAKPKPDVIELMRKKIDELGAQGVRVSLHVVSLEAYAKLNVVDIGVASTGAVAGPGFSVPKLTAAFNKLQADGYIRKFIDETAKTNHCWHVEIAPGAKPL